MNKTLTHSMKSYITIFWVGILVGCICRLTDYCPADTLWSFSSIQTLLGFWIITNTIIVLASTSNICAGISSFLYMFGMTLSFYGLQAILGTFIPLFSGGFRTSLRWTGTTRSIVKSGGMNGRSSRTAIWKPMIARSVWTCVPMPDRGFI